MPRRHHTPCRLLLPLVGLTLAACGNNMVTGPTQRAHSCVPSFTLQPAPAAVQQFCLGYQTSLCSRAFADCGTELSLLRRPYHSSTECAAAEAVSCDDDFSTLSVNQRASRLCLEGLSSASCIALAGNPPAACSSAVISVPPVASGCHEAQPGTYNDKLTTADPLYQGARIKTYCLCLTSGESVDIRTAAGASEPVGDTYLYLFAADGALEAENDDFSADDRYARIANHTVQRMGGYMIVVSGYGASDLGAYTLTIAVAKP
jgi:hypothetical protein